MGAEEQGNHNGPHERERQEGWRELVMMEVEVRVMQGRTHWTRKQTDGL